MIRIKNSKLGTLLEFGVMMSFACRRQRWSLSLGDLLKVFGLSTC